MADPQDNKPEQPVANKAGSTPAQTETAPAAEATKTAGEASKPGEASKAAKTDAAARIMERLQKAKAAAPQNKPETAAPPARPGKEKPQPRPFQEITLTGDLAKLGEALRQKMLKEQDVLATLIAQTQSESKGAAQPICDILQQRKLLSVEQLKQIKEISELKIPLTVPLPKASALDLLIGNQLMQQNLLPREEVQRILRLQATLHKLAMPITLETLLQATNALAPDVLKNLLDGLRKGVEEKKKQASTVVESSKAVKRRTALRSFDSKPWPVLRWVSAAVAVLLVMLFLFVKFAPRPVDKPRTVLEPPPMAAPQEVAKPVAKPVRKPTVEADPEEQVAKQMEARGLARWGKYWLTRQQHEELSKRWLAGEKPELTAIDISAYRVAYEVRNGKPAILLRGKLNLPALPGGLFLTMQAQLMHAFKEGNAFAEVRFALSEDHTFEVVVDELPKPLEASVYFLRLSLVAERQSEFLQDFFQLAQQQNLSWWLPFIAGSTAQVEKSVKNRRQSLEDNFKAIGECYQKLQQLPQKDATKIRKDWDSWAGQWQKSMLAIAQKIQEEQARGLIPLFPAVYAEMPQVLQQLNAIQESWDNWQRDFTQKKLPDVSENMAEFELRYDKLALTIRNEGDKLAQICKDTKINQTEGN